MKYRIWAPVLVLFPAAWFLLAACRPDVSPDLERIRLFSIPYGRFDGEIDLFTHTTGGVCPEVCFFMRDGIFYVGNASAKKVLQFTSYGDLLSVYYNPEAVPAPSFSAAGTDSGENAVRTQKAVAYPFNRISAVAVDSGKRMLVADALPSERAEYNEEEELMLENIVRICRNFDMHCVAEGVETRQQEAALLEAGCVYGQGYYYARPLPPGKFEEQFLRKQA